MIAEEEFFVESSAYVAEVEKTSQDQSIPVSKWTPSKFESERSDSGMEEQEDSFLQKSIETADGTDEDEENEIVGRKRPKGKKKMVIDDDDDEDSNDGTKQDEAVGGELVQTASVDDPDVQGTAADVEMNEESGPKSPGLPANNENEDSDGGEDSPLKLKLDNKDLFDAESSDEEPMNAPQDKGSLGGNGEETDDDKEEDQANESETNDNDEGFDEDEMDPELLEKLKKLKGASKSAKEREKYSRKAKPTADKMLELYSESQRLTRDSRVNLPYYEPQEKSLDDFLARASKKRQEYSALKRANDFQKAQIIQEKLAVTPPKLTPFRRASKRTGTQISSSQDLPALSSTLGGEGTNLQDSGLASQDLTLPLSQQASQSSTVLLQSSQETEQLSQHNVNDEQEDDLPDLAANPQTVSDGCASLSKSSVCINITDTDSKMFSNEKAVGESQRKCSQEMETDSTNVGVKNEHKAEGCGLQLVTTPSLQKDPSRDLFSSQSAVGQGSEPLYNESLETGQLQPGDSEPSSLVTVVNETPLSTQSTQISTQSLSPSVAQAVTETKVSSALSGALSESVGDLSQEECRSELSQACQTATNASQSDDISGEKQEVDLVPSKNHTQNILDKLQLQGLALPPAPKLLGTPNDIICLDDPETEKTSPKNPGLLKLMDRLTRHSQKKAPKQAYDVDISIIEKEGVKGQEELKLKSVKYHVQPEEQLIPSDGAPGSSRQKLNQYLKTCMKLKREDGRRKRLEQHQLDNEEGFEGVEQDQEEEEEEAEMTDDDENEDSDEDEEEAQLDDYGAGSDDDGENYNPLLDTEANEDDEDEEDQSDFNEDSNDFHLNFEVSDEEQDEGDLKEIEVKDREMDNDEIELTCIKKRKKRTALLSDDEDEEKSIKGETTNGRNKKDAQLFEDHTSQSLWSNEVLTPFSKHLEDTQPQGQTKFRRQSSCSPDLCPTASVAEEYESSPGPHSHNDSHSHSFDYAHSQMLDADGYLKIGQTQKPPKSRISLLAQNSSDDVNGFGSSMSIGQIFGGATSQAITNTKTDDDEDENMRELMGLCSGKFPKADDEDSLPSSQTRLKRTQSFEAKGLFDDGDDDDVYDPFHILSQDENAQDFQSLKKKTVFTDSEGEDEDKENKAMDEEDSDDGSEDEESTGLQKFTGFKDKKRGIRREFLEEEAELSGSEFDSDENLDLAEEDDILEEEEGDRDTAGLSESKLRDQVGRLHMKQLQDDDDREIMRYKEMYLQDGDLYTDGRGRRRNFRWKDMDNNSQQDMFTNESDDEQVEEDPEETQWRKDRYEREKFLEESETNGNSEDSQLVKLGQGFLQKKDSFRLSSQEFLPPAVEKAASSDKNKPSLPKKGSFLSRSKDALVKIAKMAKSALGGNVKNSRGFVFQSVDDKETQQNDLPMESPMQPPKRKAHKSSHLEQAAKKPKLDLPTKTETCGKPAVKRKNSILHLLD